MTNKQPLTFNKIYEDNLKLLQTVTGIELIGNVPSHIDISITSIDKENRLILNFGEINEK